MKPSEVWTCQRAENLKKKSSKIPKNKYAATTVSAARRQIIGGGGGAPINKSRRRRPQIVGGGGAARRGRRTALVSRYHLCTWPLHCQDGPDGGQRLEPHTKAAQFQAL